MENVFLAVLNMSLTASYIIPFVLLARLLLKKVPKIYSYCLWSVVLFRLLCPFSLETALSLLPKEAEPITRSTLIAENPEISTGIPTIDQSINPILPTAPPPETGHSVNPLQIWSFVAQIFWVCGMIVMLLVASVSLLRLKKKLVVSEEVEKGVFFADDITSPFVYGVVSPKIYLPSSISEEEIPLILAHERFHLRRLDHITRLLSFVALTLHWFNPLVWISYYLSEKDMETSCDEGVLREKSLGERGDYATALLKFTGRRTSLTPLAFSENDTKGRVKNIMKMKKYKMYSLVLPTILVFGLAFGLSTNQKEPDQDHVGELTGEDKANSTTTDTQALSASVQGFLEYLFTETQDFPLPTAQQVNVIEALWTYCDYSSSTLNTQGEQLSADDFYLLTTTQFDNSFYSVVMMLSEGPSLSLVKHSNPNHNPVEISELVRGEFAMSSGVWANVTQLEDDTFVWISKRDIRHCTETDTLISNDIQSVRFYFTDGTSVDEMIPKSGAYIFTYPKEISHHDFLLDESNGDSTTGYVPTEQEYSDINDPIIENREKLWANPLVFSPNELTEEQELILSYEGFLCEDPISFIFLLKSMPMNAPETWSERGNLPTVELIDYQFLVVNEGMALTLQDSLPELKGIFKDFPEVKTVTLLLEVKSTVPHEEQGNKALIMLADYCNDVISQIADNIEDISTEQNLLDFENSFYLYNFDEEPTAIFYKLQPVGYAIYDFNSGLVLEYVKEENHTRYLDLSKRYYYDGVFKYYELTEDGFKNLLTEQVERID